jgi:hypothetical protein
MVLSSLRYIGCRSTDPIEPSIITMKQEFGMSPRFFALPLLLVLALLAGCAREEPLAALEAAVQQLQDNLEARRNAAVLDQLTDDFRAQQSQDRDWARRTLALLFLRHQQVRIFAPARRSWLDAALSSRGYTEAQVAVSGASGLLPDSARLYSVRLEWRLEDGDWKLARLDWE